MRKFQFTKSVKTFNNENAALEGAKFNLIDPKAQKTGIKIIVPFFLLVMSTLTVSAQKMTVLNAFSKHGISTDLLDAKHLQQPEDIAYDLKQTTTTSAKTTTVVVAKFNPSNPKDEQWIVVSMDGKSPSKSDITTFRKNQTKQLTSKIDDASYKVEKELDDYLVISFKLDPTSISKEGAFMKDCRIYLTANLKTKKLEQIETINEKPVKVAIMTADKFTLVTKYIKDEELNRYLAQNQNLTMQAKFVGQQINLETITEYTNYSKNK